MRTIKYLKMDWNRAIFSKKLLIGIAGVVFALFLSIHRMAEVDISVFYVYTGAVYFIPFILSMTFCAIPYADVFCEDIEHKCFEMSIMRGNLKKYIISKIFCIYFVSLIVMVIGTLIFIVILRIQLLWVSVNDTTFDNLLLSSSLKTLLENKRYIAGIIIYSFRFGLLAANLSVLASCLSLYWQNKMLVFSVPFIAYYLQNYYSQIIFRNIPQADINQIFNATFDVWNNEVISFLWPILISFIFILALGMIMHKKLRKRMENE